MRAREHEHEHMAFYKFRFSFIFVHVAVVKIMPIRTIGRRNGFILDVFRESVGDKF